MHASAKGCLVQVFKDKEELPRRVQSLVDRWGPGLGGCPEQNRAGQLDTIYEGTTSLQVFKDKEKLPKRVQFKWIEGDPASVGALSKAGLAEAQALIIGGSSSAPPKEADAYTLTTITLAQVRPCLLFQQLHTAESGWKGFAAIASL